MNKHLFLQQLESIIQDEKNVIANLANTSAFLNEILSDINWVGFYLLENDELVLGPFQGKVACVRIPLNKGVCGTAAYNQKTIRVDNVHEFPGHIACDALSCSEIVVPMMKNNQLIGVLDIDSPSYSRFSLEDQEFLEEVVSLLIKYVV